MSRATKAKLPRNLQLQAVVGDHAGNCHNGKRVYFPHILVSGTAQNKLIINAGGHQLEQHDAIAVLFAASPDLLALLREWHDLEFKHWTTEDVEYEISVGNGMAPLVKRIRAAIAKATTIPKAP